MVTRAIRTEVDRALLIQLVKAHKLPFTIDLVKGAHRSVDQNRLQRQWINEIAEQLGDMTPEEIRGLCKLQFGVPILRAENTRFCEVYDRVVKPRSYEEKLELMMEPLDMPVTRIMTTDQKTRYLEAMSKHFLEQGVVLTEPTKRERRVAA